MTTTPETPQQQYAAVRQVLELYNTIEHNRHKLRWVISAPTRNALAAYANTTGDYLPASTPDPNEQICGMPYRIDEHATTIMLELR